MAEKFLDQVDGCRPWESLLQAQPGPEMSFPVAQAGSGCAPCSRGSGAPTAVAVPGARGLGILASQSLLASLSSHPPLGSSPGPGLPARRWQWMPLGAGNTRTGSSSGLAGCGSSPSLSSPQCVLLCLRTADVPRVSVILPRHCDGEPPSSAALLTRKA